MGVKCLAQEHNAVPRPGLEPEPFDPESSALTIRPPRHPLLRGQLSILLQVNELFWFPIIISLSFLDENPMYFYDKFCKLHAD